MIALQNLTKNYGSRVILNAVSYLFPSKGRVALVGANGAGKTTLLNIICGLEQADNGTVVKPKNVVMGYLPQEPNPNPKDTILEECMTGAHRLYELKQHLDHVLHRMQDHYSDSLYESYEKAEDEFRKSSGYSLESDAKGLLIGLGFSQEQLLQHPTALSGGWRMRLELAKLLINKPDVLILDEPTNHLDLPSMIWLENELLQYEGTLVFVSHDRALLNRLSTITLHLNQGVLTPYTGNFDAFLEQRELIQSQNQQTVKNIQKRAEEVESFIKRFGAKASKAAQARSRMKMLGRLRDLEESVMIEEDPAEIAIRLKVEVTSGKNVVSLKNVSIGYEKPLASHLSLEIMRGSKIAVVGANGIGKSTLLKSIVGNIPFLSGEYQLGHNVTMAYYAQDYLDWLDAERSALENVLAANTKMTEQRARGLLGAFLIRKDNVFKPLKVFSGGEKSRIGLSCLLSKEANFLILDEPTNHLDMSSIENLAMALDEFPGTVLMVSHNRDFIEQVCTHIFEISGPRYGQLYKIEDFNKG
ncbi:MAG: ABC-F family ATP-binding cassette domain-containing protein [Proteobacteria bacterium]|nr:ABC-F family ATP-binding cassette domain-containing protein [Pseudomonadota bacterium]